MIRSLTLTGHGLRRARRHLGTVLLVYLASLIPALLVVSLISADLEPALDQSLFADRLLRGDGFGVWVDYQRSDENDLQPISSALLGRLFLATLLQILVAAGLVEVLLDRAGSGERPFLSGIGRHGLRFVRSAVVFALSMILVVVVIAPMGLAFANAGGRVALLGVLLQALAILVVFVVLDLAYDFSRISAVSHGEGRMLVGLFKSLGFVFRHLLVLVPLYALFVLPIVGLQVGAVTVRSTWTVDTPGEVLGWLLAQQAVFFAVAFFRVALWGAEVVYYQGIGEPRWCGRRRRRPAAPPVAAPPVVERPAPTA